MIVEGSSSSVKICVQVSIGLHSYDFLRDVCFSQNQMHRFKYSNLICMRMGGVLKYHEEKNCNIFLQQSTHNKVKYILWIWSVTYKTLKTMNRFILHTTAKLSQQCRLRFSSILGIFLNKILLLFSNTHF